MNKTDPKLTKITKPYLESVIFSLDEIKNQLDVVLRNNSREFDIIDFKYAYLVDDIFQSLQKMWIALNSERKEGEKDE